MWRYEITHQKYIVWYLQYSRSSKVWWQRCCWCHFWHHFSLWRLCACCSLYAAGSNSHLSQFYLPFTMQRNHHLFQGVFLVSSSLGVPLCFHRTLGGTERWYISYQGVSHVASSLSAFSVPKLWRPLLSENSLWAQSFFFFISKKWTFNSAHIWVSSFPITEVGYFHFFFTFPFSECHPCIGSWHWTSPICHSVQPSSGPCQGALVLFIDGESKALRI